MKKANSMYRNADYLNWGPLVMFKYIAYKVSTNILQSKENEVERSIPTCCKQQELITVSKSEAVTGSRPFKQSNLCHSVV